MELERRHNMVLFTSVESNEIIDEIKRFLYAFLGADNLNKAIEKCRDPRNTRGYNITVTVEGI